MAGAVVGAVLLVPVDVGVAIDFDGPAVVVDEAVVPVADQDGVIEVRFAAEFPPVHVVCFGISRGVLAAWEPTDPIPVFECSPLCFGEGAFCAVHVEGDRVAVVGDDADGGVAREAHDGLAAEVCPAGCFEDPGDAFPGPGCDVAVDGDMWLVHTKMDVLTVVRADD